MPSGIKTVIYPVEDLAQAKALYGPLLGVEPIMDEPYYLGYRVDDQDIGFDPHGFSKGMTGPVPFWPVEDIAATIAALVASGATEQQPASDVGGGRLVARLLDTDGNQLGLIQG